MLRALHAPVLGLFVSLKIVGNTSMHMDIDGVCICCSPGCKLLLKRKRRPGEYGTIHSSHIMLEN